MTATRLVVPGISCDHCKLAIETAVAGVAGVRRVEVEVATRSVHVELDAAAEALDAVRRAIEDEGYVVA